MNGADFCKSFIFKVYTFNHCHFTDHSQKPVPWHYFGCITKGSGILKTKEMQLSLTENEIFYIPKGQTYQSQWYANEEDIIEFYSFGFDVAPTANIFTLQKVPCEQKAGELFKELCKQIPFTEKGIGLLYHFFGEVSGNMKQAKKPYNNPIVEKATQYISGNPYVSISRVAAYCNVSESAIYALFRKYIQKTPNEIRLQALCEQAVALLVTTNKSVQEISDSLGFSSTSYFRKILRKQKGKTPMEIRKESAF